MIRNLRVDFKGLLDKPITRSIVWAFMKRLLWRLAMFLVYCVAHPIVILYRLTCRIEHQGPLQEYLNTGKPFLMAWWHQDMLFNYSYLATMAQRRRISTMASRSHDGEMAYYLLIKHNFCVVRGSSSRGGSTAIKELIEDVRQRNATGVLVCDGPQPPARVAKYGIVALARETGLPVILVRSWGHRQYIFQKSWPKLSLVVPFSKVVMLSDGPIEVPKDTAREDYEKYRIRVEAGLNRLAERSERHFA